jgi:biopolymer transport protein TolQ
MITKFRELQKAASVSRRFLATYRKEAHPVSLFLKTQKYKMSPLNAIYEATCKSLTASLESRGADPAELFMGGVGTTLQRLGDMQVSLLRNVAQRTMTDQALLMEDKMGFLATSVTAAPFLGLLGTVWGVMVAFGNIKGGSAMLSDVTPGISGALLTTVIGLLVALPSSIGYNMIASQIRRLRVSMDNFVQEFSSDIERHFLHE